MEKKTGNSREEFEKLQNDLRSILPQMTPFERDVLTMRFGLDGKYSHSFEDVEKKFNITKERIRQIEVKAIYSIQKKKKSLSTNSNPQDAIKSILNSLTTREQSIVKMKYGIETGVELSDEELINKPHFYTITKEELDKIKEKVKRRIEHKPDEIMNIML